MPCSREALLHEKRRPFLDPVLSEQDVPGTRYFHASRTVTASRGVGPGSRAAGRCGRGRCARSPSPTASSELRVPFRATAVTLPPPP